MLKNRSTSMMGGIVASPTPTVPMSGDSTTVMRVRVPGRARDNMLAASQPAVPPPTMAMLPIRFSRVICSVSDIDDQTSWRRPNRNRYVGSMPRVLAPGAYSLPFTPKYKRRPVSS